MVPERDARDPLRRSTAPRPTGRRSRWTDRRIRAELAEFLEGRTAWPTAAEFNQAGRHALRRAVSQYGGVVFWAQEFGVALTSAQQRGIPYTDEDARRDATAVIDRHGWLPNVETLRAAGYPRLASHIKRAHPSRAAFLDAIGRSDALRRTPPRK